MCDTFFPFEVSILLLCMDNQGFTLKNGILLCYEQSSSAHDCVTRSITHMPVLKHQLHVVLVNLQALFFLYALKCVHIVVWAG